MGITTEQAAANQGTGVPLTISGISGDGALGGYDGSCQAAVCSFVLSGNSSRLLSRVPCFGWCLV